ncbi:MAG: sugar ABC transporter permease [Clostridia bacterium]|nr:sugar ABC transporter permease [Clostridia bacterium]
MKRSRDKAEKSITRGKRLQKWEIIFIVTMLAVPVIHWLVFWLYTNIQSILLAFQLPKISQNDPIRWDTLEIERFFSNFKGDGWAIALRNTIIYFVKDILMLPLQLFVAYFLYRKIRGWRFYQIVFYLPTIISGVAMASLYERLIQPGGPLDTLLPGKFSNFLIMPEYATTAILLFTVWLGWGGQMLLFGGALAKIPVELIESARLDGIGTFREFVYIIVPLVWGTASTIIILIMTQMFSLQGAVLLLGKGGASETQTIGYWIFYKVQLGASYYNEVSAAGFIFTLVGVPVIMFIKWLIERIPVVDY